MDKTTSFAKLPPFSCADVSLSDAQNKWQVWHRGFEICLRACKITDPGEKRDMLLAQGGIELQEIFFNLPEPEVDEEDTEEVDPYKIAIDMIEAYFAPKRLEVEERYQFWSLKPESQESLSKFLERVLELASKCNFGETATECQNIAVIDKMIQFVPEPLKKKLLRESSLSIDELIKRISACDTPFATTSSETTAKQAGKPCKACGQSHGKDQKCKAWNKNCYNCGKAGHFGSMCYSPPGTMTDMKKTKRSQAFVVAKNLGPGAVLQKQPWKKNYAQMNAGGSMEQKKPWKKNYSDAFSSERLGFEEDEGRAMKYARRMYGVDNADLDYEKLSRGTNNSDYSSYNNLW